MDILIILNNYFHDVATAILLATAVIMWVLGRNAKRAGADAELDALARAYPTLTKFAWVALAWIVIGGVPRIIFFNTHEFIPAVENGLVTVLVIKHLLMGTAVVVGAIMWVRAKRLIEGVV